MPTKERIVMFAMIAMAVSLSTFKFYRIYTHDTRLVPRQGGEYSEVVVGELKYLNPILAQSDTEKGISKLLFSGLVKINSDGTASPDLAENFVISDDGRKYTFYLQKNLKFSDGTPLTSADIAYTIDSIKAPETKSPLNKSWVDVKIKVVDQSTIEMTLPNAYGPFINNCSFGILPASISSVEFSRKIIGSGPFQYSKLYKKNDKINEIKLKRNDKYYSEKPLLDKISIKIFSEKNEAEVAYKDQKNISGLFGGFTNLGVNMDFKSSKRLGLVFNLRSEKLKDKALRQKILSGSSMETRLKLGLTTLDAPAQREKAEEIKKKFDGQNIEVDTFYFSAVKLQDVITDKNYDLLLYGFDFGNDRDPYAFWHSSQLEQNFAGYADKNSDILLEDARMITDQAARNAKYDQIFNILSSEALVKFFDPIVFNFHLKEQMKGIDAVSGNQPFSRFENVSKWYIKEKRVRK